MSCPLTKVNHMKPHTCKFYICEMSETNLLSQIEGHYSLVMRDDEKLPVTASNCL